MLAIKDMDIPCDCWNCDLKCEISHSGLTVCSKTGTALPPMGSTTERNSNCPLIEINTDDADDDMKLYWPSAIIFDKTDDKPWLCASSDSCLSLDEAKSVIQNMSANYNVIAAWINDDKHQTVFHECYINALGIKTNKK